VVEVIASSKLPIGKACSAFSISSPAYYRWRKQKEIPDPDKGLRMMLHKIASEFPKYGYRRMTKELQRRELEINHKKVLRLMREENLLVRKKKFRPITTNSNHGLQKYPNLVKDLRLTGINQAWVSDITFIHLLREFVYLAVIMDLFSRRCIGWALSRNPDAQLTLYALNMAIALRSEANVKDCIHHSDQGVQYAAKDYVERLKQAGMRPSMGEKGNSYENAHAESFIKTIKYEEVHMNEYETLEDVYINIQQFIEEVYNKKRLHSSIGYVPPEEFEQEVLNMCLT
jgi:transposase InsO family protein